MDETTKLLHFLLRFTRRRPETTQESWRRFKAQDARESQAVKDRMDESSLDIALRILRD